MLKNWYEVNIMNKVLLAIVLALGLCTSVQAQEVRTSSKVAKITLNFASSKDIALAFGGTVISKESSFSFNNGYGSGFSSFSSSSNGYFGAGQPMGGMGFGSSFGSFGGFSFGSSMGSSNNRSKFGI